MPNPTEKLHVNGNVQADSFLYNSDRRLKSDITKLDNSLDKIMRLNGYSYVWKTTNKADIWVIAQEVELIFPDLVHTDKSSGMKSVGYGNLVAPIIEAIKELTTQFESYKIQLVAHEKILNDLKTKNTLLEKQNQELNNRLERLEKLVK